MSGILLDTHVALWLMSGEKLAKETVQQVQKTSESGSLFVSPITAWEIATLVCKNRIVLTMPTELWFSQMLSKGISLAEMGVDVLIASTSLPGQPPGDPADRIIIATSRIENLILFTRDSLILEYGELGHARVQQC